MSRWSMALLATVAFAGCKTNAACRPSTLLVTIAGSAPSDVDTLQLTVIDDQGTLNAITPFSGNSGTVEVQFPAGRYVGGKTVALTVLAMRSNFEVARFDQAQLVLPKSCAAVTASLMAVESGSGSDGGATGGDMVGSDLSATPVLLNGDHCSGDGDCGSSHCVDGVCCDGTCTGQCEACDVTGSVGKCTAVGSGPPHGARTACSGAAGSACAGTCSSASRTSCTYPGPTTICSAQSCSAGVKHLAAGCDQAGGCAAPQSLTCPQGCSGNDCLGACTTDTQCAQADATKPYCDNGVCTPKKPNGHACSSPTECTSGSCADGYCCNNDCVGNCQSCKETGSVGTCVKITGAVRTGGTPARTACANYGSAPCGGTCDGSSTDCVYPGSGTFCGCSGGKLYGCNSAGSCATVTSSCASGVCFGSSTCSTQGQPCSSSTQCTSGLCLGGYCCSQSSCPGNANEYCAPSSGDCGCSASCPSDPCASGDDGCGGQCGCPAGTYCCYMGQYNYCGNPCT